MASMNDGAGVGAGGASSGAGMGAGAGADVGDTAMTTDRFQLSNVYKGDDVSYTAVCVTTSGMVVCGTNNGVIRGWLVSEANEFTLAVTIPLPADASTVWSLLAGPKGTIVAGLSGGTLVVYDSNGKLVQRLVGHSGHVNSLAWMADPSYLASGAWGGEVRVWDMRTGQAVAVLDEHENATSVCALPNGDLVTGSSGRQTAPGALPSQFRLRLWREGTMVKMVEDHTNSIKCLAVMPGIGFASSSNDGTVRIRSHDMTALQTFETTKRASGHHNGVFKVRCLPGNVLATCDEDYATRLYSADSGLLQNLMLPGDAGDVTMLPNGDVLTVGTAVHHGALLVVWTQDASRAAAPAVVAQYYEYMQGIKKWVENLRKREMGEPDGPVGEIELPPGYDLKGLFSQRATLPGTKHNEKGFFQADDGSIIFCVWNAAKREWEGGYQYSGYRSDDGQRGNTVSIGGVEAAYNRDFDYVEKIELDMTEGKNGTKVTYLYFNATEDPNDILRRYMKDNGIPNVPEYVSQLQTKILSEWQRVNAQHKALHHRQTYEFFPTDGFVSFHKGALEKPVGRLRAFATAAETKEAEALRMADIEAAVATLGKTSFYHSTKFSRSQALAMAAAVTTLPVTEVFAALDLYRAFLAHPDGALQALQTDTGKQVIARILKLVSDPSSSFPTLVFAWRCATNFYIGPCRDLLLSKMPELVAATVPALSAAKKTLRMAALSFLRGAATLFHVLATDSKKATPHGAMAIQIAQVLATALPNQTDAKAVMFALVTLGEIAWLTDETHSAVRGLTPALGGENITAAATADADVATCLRDLKSLLGA